MTPCSRLVAFSALALAVVASVPAAGEEDPALRHAEELLATTILVDGCNELCQIDSCAGDCGSSPPSEPC